jgi:hypothetical protein
MQIELGIDFEAEFGLRREQVSGISTVRHDVAASGGSPTP